MADKSTIDDKLADSTQKVYKPDLFYRIIESKPFKYILYGVSGLSAAIIVVVLGYVAYDKISNIGKPSIELTDVTVQERWLQIDEITVGGGNTTTVSTSDVKTPCMTLKEYNEILCGSLVIPLKEGDVLESVNYRPESNFFGGCHEVVSYTKDGLTRSK